MCVSVRSIRLLIAAVMALAVTVRADIYDVTPPQALDRMIAEAAAWWSSALFYPELANNIYHPNYLCAPLGDNTSTWLRRWEFDEDDCLIAMSWQGNPYGLGCNDRCVNNDGSVTNRSIFHLTFGL